MTNLELEKMLKDANKRIDDLQRVIGSSSQRVVSHDNLITQVRDELLKLSGEIATIKTIINSLTTSMKSSTHNYMG